MEKFNQVLDYSPMHPNTTIRYHVSDIILMTDTDAAYPVLPTSCSCISFHCYFTNPMIDYSKGTPTPNGPILPEFKTLKTVLSSSSGAKTGGSFEIEKN